MRIITKDILTVDSGVVVHQVNCRGQMGAGLAKSIRDRYPSVYIDYKKMCERTNISDLIGKVLFVQISESLYIANLFGQINCGRNKYTIYTSYPALQSGLTIIQNFASSNLLDVYIPHLIGCGLANGNWNIVSEIISNTIPNAIICKLP